ncbi:MAG: outer membrane insertion C- signal, partial [Firmicutes bacterium]|nr:outer membrane insertion C- signal [Bacillota bacterium]
MIQKKEIPVYLFTGFLDAGKTTFIQETMEDPAFNDGQRTLLLVCEEGEEDFSPVKFASSNVKVVTVEDVEELSVE